MGSNSSADPFWGSPTCQANFCEEDYAMTKYIGEFINTFTNLVYVYYGIYGMTSLRKKPNASSFRAIPYWGLIGVGVFSAAFHASLKYHTQMLDDLSMHLATMPVLHRVLTVGASQRNTTIAAILIGTFLIGLFTFHLVTDELILHTSTFGVSIVTIGIRTMQLIRIRTPPDSAARRQIWGMVRFGAVIFNVGYYAWLVDVYACGFLKSSREMLGLPLGFLLELHGWWHICTGIGAYIFIAVADQLASGDELQDVDNSFAWPAPWASRSIFAGKEAAGEKKQD